MKKLLLTSAFLAPLAFVDLANANQGNAEVARLFGNTKAANFAGAPSDVKVGAENPQIMNPQTLRNAARTLRLDTTRKYVERRKQAENLINWAAAIEGMHFAADKIAEPQQLNSAQAAELAKKLAGDVTGLEGETWVGNPNDPRKDRILGAFREINVTTNVNANPTVEQLGTALGNLKAYEGQTEYTQSLRNGLVDWQRKEALSELVRGAMDMQALNQATAAVAAQARFGDDRALDSFMVGQIAKDALTLFAKLPQANQAAARENFFKGFAKAASTLLNGDNAVAEIRAFFPQQPAFAQETVDAFALPAAVAPAEDNANAAEVFAADINRSMWAWGNELGAKLAALAGEAAIEIHWNDNENDQNLITPIVKEIKEKMGVADGTAINVLLGEQQQPA